jgi:hypothetical protein
LGGPGATVTVTHTNPAVAQLVTTAGAAQTRSVTIAAGSGNSPTSVVTGGVAFDPTNPGSTTVSASATGFDLLRTESVTVTAPGIAMFSLPVTVGAGLQYGTFTARLGGTQHGGVTMRIGSSDPQVLRISSNATTPGTDFIDVFVADGATDVSYFVQGVESTTGTVTITASASGFVNGTGTGHVVQPGLQIENLGAIQSATATSDEFYVRVGIPNGVGTALVQSQDVRAGGSLTVTLTNSNAAAAQLVTQAGGAQSRTVVIHAGVDTSPITVAIGGVAFDPLQVGNTTVTASIPGFLTTLAGSVAIEVR